MGNRDTAIPTKTAGSLHPYLPDPSLMAKLASAALSGTLPTREVELPLLVHPHRDHRQRPLHPRHLQNHGRIEKHIKEALLTNPQIETRDQEMRFQNTILALGPTRQHSQIRVHRTRPPSLTKAGRLALPSRPRPAHPRLLNLYLTWPSECSLESHPRESLNPRAIECQLHHRPDSNLNHVLTVVTGIGTGIGIATVTGIETEGGMTEETIGIRVVSVTRAIPVISGETIVGLTTAMIKEETRRCKISGQNATMNALQTPSNDQRSCYGPNRVLLFPKSSLSQTLSISANQETSL
jgi:hypothetical protein